MIRIILIQLFLIQFIFTSKAISNDNWFCQNFNFSKLEEPQREKYLNDCQLSNKFHNLKADILKIKNRDINDLIFYKGLRLMDKKIYLEGREKGLEISKILKPEFNENEPNKDSVWSNWENGNNYIKILTNRDRFKWHNLKISHIKELHKQTISESIIGSNNNGLLKLTEKLKQHGFALKYIYNNLNSKSWYKVKLRPGELRHGIIPTHKIPLTKKEYEDLAEDRLVKEGIINLECPGSISNRLLMFLKDITLLRPSSYYGALYTDSIHVKDKLEKLLYRINKTMKRYYDCKRKSILSLCPTKSPIEFATEVQREYAAIHPFNDGCGRTSRILQDLILGTLGFPFIPGGELQNDVSSTDEKYYKASSEVLKSTLDQIEQCTNYFKNIGTYTEKEKNLCIFVD